MVGRDLFGANFKIQEEKGNDCWILLVTSFLKRSFIHEIYSF